MSDQEKKYKDYLIKQVIIQRNVVTYRSFSREFGIHVNNARQELQTFHHDAPYAGHKFSATFAIGGTVAPPRRRKQYSASQDEDAYLDIEMSFSSQSVATQPQSQISKQTDRGNVVTADGNGSQDVDEDVDEGEEYDDGDEVDKTQVVLVNDNDLEAAKHGFKTIDFVHIYSLSPAALKDAGIICSVNEAIREKDRAGGAAFASKVGRIIGKDIKMSGTRKVKPAVPAPVAGPSTTKGTAQGRTDAQAAKTSMPASATTGTGDKGKAKEKEKEKQTVKQTGSKTFFQAPVKKEVKQEEKAKVDAKEKENEKEKEKAKQTTKQKEKEEKAREKEKEKERAVASAKPKEVKKEAPGQGDGKKMMFFGKSTTTTKPKATSRAPSDASEGVKPAAKTSKGKTVEASSREETPEEEEEEPKPKRGLKRKSSVGHESRDKTPENPAESSKTAKKGGKEARFKGRMVVSDDDDDEECEQQQSKRTTRKRRGVVSDEDDDMASEREREARAIMDIDDELVEKVTRPSKSSKPTSSKVKEEDVPMETDNDDDDVEMVPQTDASEDVEMSMMDEDDDGSDVPERAKAAAKKALKKEKKIVPIGKNGLKKRRVIKTRKTMGKDGYFRSEDYSDYESVDEEEPEPEPKAKKAKSKAAAVKQEATESGTESAGPTEGKKKAAAAAKPRASASAKVKAEPKDAADTAPAAKSKPAPAKLAKKTSGTAGKTQKGLMSFFGPKK